MIDEILSNVRMLQLYLHIFELCSVKHTSVKKLQEVWLMMTETYAKYRTTPLNMHFAKYFAEYSEEDLMDKVGFRV